LAIVESLEEMRMMVTMPRPELYAKAVQELKDGKGTRYDPQIADIIVEILETQEGLW
jgi:HD-GYP domain-containing protein (c-di-GMP phosphodiesterase class II)